jgi:RNA polymerase sigma factor (sigma-70 family)
MKEVPIKTKTGYKVALVDNEDYDLVSKHKWCICKGYAHTFTKGRPILMHQLILGKTKGKEIDHIFGNTLDNRKSKLRICTRAQNGKNRKKGKNNTSGYKGIFCTISGKWGAKIVSDGKTTCLGSYSMPEDAAFAYNLGAIRLHGEYAALNVIRDVLPPHIDEKRYIATQLPRVTSKTPLDILQHKDSDVFVRDTINQVLTYREKEVIKLRFGFKDGIGFTFEEIAKVFKVTKERVGQIHKNAISKLKSAIPRELVA